MATKKAGGRLPRYKTKEEIEEKIEAYFRSCEGEVLLDENGNAVTDKGGPSETAHRDGAGACTGIYKQTGTFKLSGETRIR